MNQPPAREEDDPVLLQQQIRQSFEQFERSFRKRWPLVWLLTLVGPFVLSAAILAVIYLTAGQAVAWRVLGTATATFFFFGRFVILGGHEGQLHEVTGFLTSEQLFLMVTYMDLMVAVLVTFHLGFLFRLPLIGPKIADLVVDGQYILSQHRWMKRATLAGLVLFVTFPLAATGSIGGAVFGRLLGLSRVATLLGILAGSLLGNSIMYFGSDALNAWLDKRNPVVQYGGLVVIALVIVLLERRYRAMKRRFAEQHQRRRAAQADSPEPLA